MRRKRLAGVILPFGVLLAGGAAGQVVHDGSLGIRGALAGPNYVVPAARGRVVGANLFHSFSAFNLARGQSATFQSAGPAVARTFARVTGGKPSTLRGLLRAPTDLYLINPAGVVFGAGARLDVAGAFAVTSADFIRLGDGGLFHASCPSDSVLNSAAPAAFGFLGKNPAPLRVVAPRTDPALLAVPDGQSLSLVGGNVRISGGKLVAPQGRINVVAVGSPGQVAFDPADPAAKIDVAPFPALASVALLDGSEIDADGVGGGSVILRGENLTVTGSSIHSITQGSTPGGDIDIALRGALDFSASTFRADVAPDAAGDGGDLVVEAGSLNVAGGAFSVDTRGSGDGGDLVLRGGAIDLRIASLTADVLAGGNGGDVRIDAGSLSLAAARISSNSAGSGRSGSLGVNVADALSIDGSVISTLAQAEGRGGDVRVSADSLSLVNGGVVASSTFGPARGGSVNIRARHITATGPGDGSATASVAAGSVAGGDSGGLRIAAERLVLKAGAAITTSANGAGRGGNARLLVREIEIDGSGEVPTATGVFADSLGSGDSGDVRILGADRLAFRDGGVITSTTVQGGLGGELIVEAKRIDIDGGNLPMFTGVVAGTAGFNDSGAIGIDADSLVVRRGGTINASSEGPGAGGLVAVRAKDIRVAGAPAGAFASSILSAAAGSGPGGQIILRADSVAVRDGGTIGASTTGPGQGGELFIEADRLVLDGGRIGASTSRGVGGGAGGAVAMALGRLEILGGGQINATTSGSGEGGGILIQADTVRIQGPDDPAGERTAIASRSLARRPGRTPGAAGGVALIADGSIEIDDADLAVSARRADAGLLILVAVRTVDLRDAALVGESPATGGQVFVSAAERISLLDSRISGRSGAQGQIIALNLDAQSALDPGLVLLNRSVIDGRSQGTPVKVDINSSSLLFQSLDSAILTDLPVIPPVIDIAGSLLPLESAVRAEDARLADACVVRLDQLRVSTFVVTGAGGFAPQPGGFISDVSLPSAARP